jgi:hypothetical protein
MSNGDRETNSNQCRVARLQVPGEATRWSRRERAGEDGSSCLTAPTVCVCFDGPFLQLLTIDDGLSLSVRVHIGVRRGYGSCVSTTLHRSIVWGFGGREQVY